MAESCLSEWQELSEEFTQLKAQHVDYIEKVRAVKAVQQKCMSNINHQRYRMKQIQDSLSKIENADPDTAEKLKELDISINERKKAFRHMEDVLPHENGIYLKIILGSVNVSLLSRNDKLDYKGDYEKFKLVLSVIILVFACFMLFVENRVTDACFSFLLVWYYCTLTIREHILKVNGSRIKGWWISHHFISCFCSGVLLIWPPGFSYGQFRIQFVWFSVYLSLVQIMQFHYQRGILYRLRALGEQNNMHITVEGFQSWMWRGLTGILPLLCIAYAFQLYNAYTLYYLSLDPRCTEWQVFVLSIVFFVLFLGNTWTTLGVIVAKFTGGNRKLETIVKNVNSNNGNETKKSD